MLKRCYRPNRRDARYYKDKGIRICNEWLNNPEAFKEWAINNGWEPGLTIDRIDSMVITAQKIAVGFPKQTMLNINPLLVV